MFIAKSGNGHCWLGKTVNRKTIYAGFQIPDAFGPTSWESFEDGAGVTGRQHKRQLYSLSNSS